LKLRGCTEALNTIQCGKMGTDNCVK